jgi:polyferredoxin
MSNTHQEIKFQRDDILMSSGGQLVHADVYYQRRRDRMMKELHPDPWRSLRPATGWAILIAVGLVVAKISGVM